MEYKIYYDEKSKQDVELIELNDKERFMIIRPIGSTECYRLEFQRGFYPSVYLEKYFTLRELK